MAPLLVCSRQRVDKGRWAEAIISSFAISMDRISKRNERHPFYLTITGHMHLQNQNYSDALKTYQRARDLLGPGPMSARDDASALLLLLIGVCQLHYSLQRNCDNRQYRLLESFRTMKKYAEARGWSPEACYNLGRWMDHCGLSQYAIYYYNRVLEGRKPGDLFVYEAAFHLSLLYIRSGNYVLASYYMTKYANARDLFN
jgi:hypothetical protein